MMCFKMTLACCQADAACSYLLPHAVIQKVVGTLENLKIEKKKYPCKLAAIQITPQGELNRTDGVSEAIPPSLGPGRWDFSCKQCSQRANQSF